MHIEDVARFPLPGCALPAALRFSPDGSLVTYLASPEEGLRMSLCATDLATGARRPLVDPRDGGVREGAVSREEALRRERLRQRAVGVTSYLWADQANRILVPLGGALLALGVPDAPARVLVPAGGAPILDARISRDGRWVGFVRDAEVHVVPFDGGDVRQATTGARGTGLTNGLAEYVAQEEMHRHRGWWFSDDARWIAFEAVDDTHIPAYRIVHQGKDAVGDAAQEDHRYPFAGAANATWRLGVVPREGGEPVWMECGDWEYLARVDWAPDGSLWVQVQDRPQRTLALVRLDPATGRGEEVLRETSATWINLHQMLRFVPRCDAAPGGGFVWASERDGFQHLQLHALDGTLLRRLTSGEWMVDSLAGLDAARGLLWCTGTRDGVTERHLYEVALAGGDPRRITRLRGVHDVVVDPPRRRFADVHSALDRAPRAEVCSLDDGAVLVTLHDGAADPRIASTGIVPPELVTLPARDGTTLHGAVYRPDAARFGAGPRPVVVSVYGGPHVQRVQDSWELTAGMRAQYLRSLGFLVFVLDNRGSARRGVAFEAAIHRNMGDLEVRDQEDGVRWLAAQGLADPARVAIYGWSYGGYMAAMCLARAPETFRCAVAGAPVTHWDGYDTHYTERYMDLPDANAEGYRVSSVMHHVANLRGPLLLVHGLLDENVHFRHTARLVHALNGTRKRYELLMLPDERHMPRAEADRVHMEERVRDFLVRELGAGEPSA